MCELRIQIPRLLSRKQILQGKGLGTYIITNDPNLSEKFENCSKQTKPFAFPSTWPMVYGSVVKNPPAMQETEEMQVLSLGWEGPLDEEIANHSSNLAWKKSHGQKNLTGYSPWVTKSRIWQHTHKTQTWPIAPFPCPLLLKSYRSG